MKPFVTVSAEAGRAHCDRLVRLPIALERAGISRSNAYRLMAAGQFPRPVKLGRMNLFSERELQDWITQQLAQRVEV